MQEFNMTKYINIYETQDSKTSSQAFDTLVEAVEWIDSDYIYTIVSTPSTGLPIVKTVHLEEDGLIEEYILQIKQETAHREAY
jgi:hypothetical protein